MTSERWYVTCAIPYVNAAPHLGHALEFVQADALARWRCLRGDDVRAQWGTDDHAAKNVAAARAAGEGTAAFVDRHADGFAALAEPLQLGFDAFVRTSRDARHRPAVERLWRRCLAAGDLYRGRYEGRYCGGCERFYDLEELRDGRCPEHRLEPESVVEDNWFFRLSRHAARVAEEIRSGRLRVEPVHRRNEILAFLDGPVRDISVSRPAARSSGWGIPVPDDPDQVVYVWFDALTNYLSGLGYGTRHPDHGVWWAGADRRVHVIGKGILRFHAAYWPAFLLSAGERLPTDVLVHEYLTVGGAKISKSLGTNVHPADLVEEYGTDALRWWLLSDVNALVDTDFRAERLVQRHDEDLANGLGNLIARVHGLVHRYGEEPGTVRGTGVVAGTRSAVSRDLQEQLDAAVERLDHRAATATLRRIVDEANSYIDRHRPWEAMNDADRVEEAATVLAELVEVCWALADHLEPFLPAAAERVRDALRGLTEHRATPLFPRIQA